MAVEWGYIPHVTVMHRAQPMASTIRDKSGNYPCQVPLGKAGVHQSLHTKDETVADLGVARVNDTLMRLKRGLLEMPSEAEPGEFIVSGGTLIAKPSTRRPRQAFHAQSTL